MNPIRKTMAIDTDTYDLACKEIAEVVVERGLSDSASINRR